MEHRAAATPPTVALQLVSDPPPVRLEVQNTVLADTAPSPSWSLPEQILAALKSAPRRQDELRAVLRVRSQRLVGILHELETAGHITRSSSGWRLADSSGAVSVPIS